MRRQWNRLRKARASRSQVWGGRSRGCRCRYSQRPGSGSRKNGGRGPWSGWNSQKLIISLGEGIARWKHACCRKQVTHDSRSKVNPIRSDVVKEGKAQIVKSTLDLWIGCRIGPHCFPVVQKFVLQTSAHGQMRRHQHIPSDHENQVPIHEQRPWS